MLESCFERLCTLLSLVRSAGKIPSSVNYMLLCAGIMSLNHNEYKIMNAIRKYNDKHRLCFVGMSAGKYSQHDRSSRDWRDLRITGQLVVLVDCNCIL